MSWQDILKEALDKSPVKGSSLRQSIKRPKPLHTTGKRPKWERTAYPLDKPDQAFTRPKETDEGWEEVSPGKWIKRYK